jgi:hypothetical protein
MAVKWNKDDKKSLSDLKSNQKNINSLYMLSNMRKNQKLGLGIIFCLLGVIILISSFLYAKFIPGGFISLAVGILLISDSKKN